MAGIDDRVLEEIKQRTELSELIASYGIAVKRNGSSVKACCPFHTEKTPSFNINDAKGFYHCFGCGESGDAIKFVEKYEGVTFIEAVKKLAERCGVKIEEAKEDPELGKRKKLHALLAELAEFYHRCLLKTKEADLARKYLEERALGGKIADDYLIGYAPNGVATILKWGEKYHYTAQDLEAAGVILGPKSPGDKGYHRFGGRLMFSIRDRQGRVVGFSGRQLIASKNSGKYVNSPETAVFKKSNVLYGYDKACSAIARAKHREAIVCEGQIDCIRLQTSGFPNAVAGQGTAFTGEHVKMLKKVADEVTLVYDDDGAGHKATIKSARLCLGAGLPVRVVSLPDGDDPDSFLRTHPAAEFQSMLDNAVSIMSFQVRAERAKESRPDTVDAVNRIVRELLTTVAHVENAVLRESMLAEAGKLLSLPVIALREELGKVKIDARAMAAATAPDEAEGEESDPGLPADAGEAPGLVTDTAAMRPPPKRETSFMALLLSNGSDAAMESVVAEFLPPEIFAHDFTRRFVAAWRKGVREGTDWLPDFEAALSEREQFYFMAVMADNGKSEASGETPMGNLQNFVRNLWRDFMHRFRGSLPVECEGEMRKLKGDIMKDMGNISSCRWSAAKEMIRRYMLIFKQKGFQP